MLRQTQRVWNPFLIEFFEFYSQFDFFDKSNMFKRGGSFDEPEFSAMYIINPLERGLNVSKNVSLEEVDRFKVEVHNAAWTLESQENKGSNWGLLSIFENKKSNYTFNFYNPAKQARLMEVTKKRIEEVEFKNEQVKQEISKIKKNTVDKIKAIENNIKRQNNPR
ncbi:hypothetical protein NQ317_010273 [Molorchus minor]|uniref:PAP-associated domain-containing protein n=1 Tax=Molorchus minor TaxID=1323400 RepID=A0ABQ9JEI2_9CUCU|nr:hypothetical protein NQ317_010273 [Molorchus minor]